MFNLNIFKHYKSSLVGTLFLLIGLILFLDCWLEYTGDTCGLEAKSYVGGMILLGMTLLFLDEDDFKAKLSRLADIAINLFGKSEPKKNTSKKKK